MPHIVDITEKMKKIRLDKLIADKLGISRKQSRVLIYTSQVLVNGKIEIHIDAQVSQQDNVVCQGNTIEFSEGFVYYILHKPEGYITADKDKFHKTVMELLPVYFSKEKIMPVGRLDIDTTGLLLFTNHGALAYRLLSPKRKICKTYIAKIDRKITQEDIDAFAKGLDLGDFTSQPAELAMLDVSQNLVSVTLHEGKFHQVKRMFEAVSASVLTLHRQSFGPLQLDIPVGAYKQCSQEEVQSLFTACAMKEE